MLNLIFPLLAAKMLFHLRRQGAAYLYRVLLTAPIVIPIMVTLLLWRFIYDPYDGLLNQLLQAIGLGSLQRAWLGDFQTALYAVIGLGFPWVTGIGNAGFAFLIYLGGLQEIPREIFDAAAVDGASAARRFWRIELPMIAAQIKLILLLTIINTMESYVPVMVMTGGGPGVSSMVPGLYLYEYRLRLRQVWVRLGDRRRHDDRASHRRMDQQPLHQDSERGHVVMASAPAFRHRPGTARLPRSVERTRRLEPLPDVLYAHHVSQGHPPVLPQLLRAHVPFPLGKLRRSLGGHRQLHHQQPHRRRLRRHASSSLLRRCRRTPSPGSTFLPKSSSLWPSSP